jgi:hypothetical protein
MKIVTSFMLQNYIYSYNFQRVCIYNGLEENDRGLNFQTYRACFPTIYYSF